MMRTSISLTFVVLLCAGVVAAQQTDTCGWEDPSTTVLYTYPASDSILSTNVDTTSYTGNRCLQLEDNLASGTPQVYVAWITGLADGDQITATVWVYDTTDAGAPSGRLWGHWNDTGTIDGFSGTPGVGSDYSTGVGWNQISYTWTVADGHTGFVVEIRTYSNPGDTIWVDDLEVTIPNTATFEDIVPVELQSFDVE